MWGYILQGSVTTQMKTFMENAWEVCLGEKKKIGTVDLHKESVHWRPT
jgi:hypothetical protein